MNKKHAFAIIVPALCIMLAGCGVSSQLQETLTKTEKAETEATTMTEPEEQEAETVTADLTEEETNTGDTVAQEEDTQAAEKTQTGSAAFTDRDLAQTADLSEALYETVEDGTDLNIHAAGVYVISGSAKNATLVVDAADEDKVQIVLDGVSIENDDFPCIYVKNADKVFVTSTDSDNTLSVTGTFRSDGTTNTDAVIYSRDDLVLNGTGTIAIASTDNGISGKDDLKITGGTITIDCASDALEANDSILIADGNITINTKKDALHAENDDDNTTGEIVISGGVIDITAGDDGIHGTTTVKIDDGDIKINAAEGIEATVIEVNGGTIDIAASDDGINAARKSTFATPSFTLNAGKVSIDMGGGDTDAIDSNGDLIINGGTLAITAQFPFDYDGTGELNGGTVTVNGTEISELANQFMGGGHGGFPGSGRGGFSGEGQSGFSGRGGRGGGRGGFPGATPKDAPEGATDDSTEGSSF